MIIPAILEENFDEVKRKIKLLEGVASVVQVDIVDGTIVEGKTFSDIQRLRNTNSETDINIHFMVENPLKFIKASIFFNILNKTKIPTVSTLITQMIKRDDLDNFINFSEKHGYKIGLSINSDEDVTVLEPYLKKLSVVQFMGVIPGKQGNPLIPEVLDKIKFFKKRFPDIKTQIDGGVNETTLPQILETGVDNIVVGSAIFNSEDPKEKFLEFSSIFNERTAYGSKGN